MNRSYWAGVTAATAFGGLVGYVIGRTLLEKELRDDYAARVKSMEHVFDLRLEAATRPFDPMVDDLDMNEVAVGVEKPKIDIFDKIVEKVDGSDEGELWVQPDGSIVETPSEGLVQITPMERETPNDYHKAIAATETPVEMFVGGGVNDYGVSYIEEEEYLEEDGRFKGKIDIMMYEHNPIFMMDGQQIDDWDARIGDSILVDFYRLVPPGVDRILYVRNHRSDEDYEVVQVAP